MFVFHKFEAQRKSWFYWYVATRELPVRSQRATREQGVEAPACAPACSRWLVVRFHASTNSLGQPPIWLSTSSHVCPPKTWSAWFLKTVFASRGIVQPPLLALRVA